jgi:hypothetical protein
MRVGTNQLNKGCLAYLKDIPAHRPFLLVKAVRWQTQARARDLQDAKAAEALTFLPRRADTKNGKRDYLDGYCLCTGLKIGCKLIYWDRKPRTISSSALHLSQYYSISFNTILFDYNCSAQRL